MVSSLSLIFNSSSSLSKCLGTVPGNNYYHPYFYFLQLLFLVVWQVPSICQYFGVFSFPFWDLPKQQNPLDSKFFSYKQIQDQVFWMGFGDSFLSLNTRKFYDISFSWKDSDLYIYHLVVWSNFILFHNSQSITFSTHLCLILYSFCFSLYITLLWN